jgi:hypothetical protein
MASIQFPPYDSPPTDPNDYLVTPFEAPNGSKWTWGGDAKPRWTAWSEPPLTEIAWDDVTDKPAAVTALSGANTGDQDLSGLATTSALSSGLAGKAPASGISPSAITGTAVVTDDSRLSDARTPTAHTHAASDITGTAVTLSGNQTLTGTKTFSSLATNGTVVFGAGTTFFADTAAANSARSALGVARGIETVGSSQAAVVGGRYITTAAVTITDPTTRIDGSALQNGDSYEVWIGGPGNATIDGVAYVPSRFSIRRARISGAWTTPAATVTGAFNATTIGANTPGTGAFTTVTASGEVSCSNGTAALPALTFGESNTGIFRPAANRFAFAAAGAELLTGYISGCYMASGKSFGINTANWFRIGAGGVELTTTAAGGIYAPLTVSNLTASGTLSVTGAATLTGGVILPTSTTPASATAAGVAGTICRDANYIYVCTATNTWKRVAISTW